MILEFFVHTLVHFRNLFWRFQPRRPVLFRKKKKKKRQFNTGIVSNFWCICVFGTVFLLLLQPGAETHMVTSKRKSIQGCLYVFRNAVLSWLFSALCLINRRFHHLLAAVLPDSRAESPLHQLLHLPFSVQRRHLAGIPQQCCESRHLHDIQH